MVLLEKMSRYLTWADSTIWRIVENLTDEEYSRNLYDNGGSIQSRYIHLAEDWRDWYIDWTGKKPDDKPDFINLTRDEVFASIKKYRKLFTDIVDTRAVEHIDIETEGEKLRITFDEILFHLVNHATYHRGQIVMGLRILGKDVVMTDYVPYRIQICEEGER